MSFVFSFLLAFLAPIYGGIFYGLDRVVKAKMQGRKGPPLMQPFYDMFKLFNKDLLLVNSAHIIWMIFYFLTLWIVMFMIFFGGNILYIIFAHLLASIFFIASGFSVKSIFSQIGSNRKLLSLISYEPILLVNAVAIYLTFGTFEISEIMQTNPEFSNLIFSYLSLLLVVPTILKLSPFDAPKAHQEIVGGVEVEFVGAFYEIVYASKFLEIIFIYSFIFILFGSSWLLGLLLVAFTFLLVSLVDNSTSRINANHMVKLLLSLGLGLAVISILWIKL